ncbi:response regulator [Herminiimonas sp.]|uniref:response regulator n=1 Tax=Herminiimonas sp. TaxID=1926289 RepID=UPI00351E2D58
MCEFVCAVIAHYRYRTLITKCTILVVDDEVDILAILEDVLTLHGFNVVTANSVKKAQSQLETNKIDLIISDVMMPDTRGTEFRQFVQNDSRYHSIPFVFMTGFTPVSDPLTGYILGKPFDFERLMGIIDKALENTRCEWDK